MKSFKYSKFALIPVILFFLFPARHVDAIPAFARKYQISCQVCHSPALPRLKPFGDEFAGNGFRLTEYESPRYFIQTGDDKFSFQELPCNQNGWLCFIYSGNGSSDFGAPFAESLR
jgi:hypothetical protein